MQWKGVEEDCARHHILPRSRLEKFFNKLAENNQTHHLPTFFGAYKVQFSQYYVAKSKDHNKDYKDMIVNVINFVNGMIYNDVVHDPSQNRPENFDEFGAYFTWLPKDVFIGPKNRDDDPGDRFEDDSKYIIGGNEFKTLSKINQMIHDYMTGKAISVYNIDKELAQLLKKKPGDHNNSTPLLPYPYDEKDWSRHERTGKYSIKKKKIWRRKLHKIPSIINDTIFLWRRTSAPF